MSKFNVKDTRAAVKSPIQSEKTSSGRTFEGAPGYARDEKSELFLLAVTNMVGEKTFYESADARDERYEKLVSRVAVVDPMWMLNFLTWLRSQGNMRTASLVGAAIAVKARLDANARIVGEDGPGVNRQMINVVLQRADEPGEMLAYWTSRYGRKIPKPVKRGVADAVKRLYTEYNLLKYDTASKGYRFADIIDLVHPDAVAPWQGALYEYALDRRHGREEEISAALEMIHRNKALRFDASVGLWYNLLNADSLKAAGFTWEDALSLAGSKVGKKELWEAVIPSMGYMALLRNLRNFDSAGVSDKVAAKVIEKLTDPEQIVRSKQFPFRFLSAYKAVSNLRWAYPLEQALNGSMGNVPELKGRTLVLVDRSGSMFGSISEKTGLNRADAAALFGSVLALRNAGRVDLVQFGTSSHAVNVFPGSSLLPLISQFQSLGGTNTAQAVAQHYRSHDRVVIITDEQATGATPTRVVPDRVPVYTWNLAGYRMGHGPSSGTRHTFGGLTDAAFIQMQLLEAGRDASWPWDNK